MSIILNIILFVLILGVIVCVHEFGHFILAKMNGVYVYEFSIGMGPRIWGFKKGETDYNIRLIPHGRLCHRVLQLFDNWRILCISRRRFR